MVLKVMVILMEHGKGELTLHDSPTLQVNGKAIARHEMHSSASIHMQPWTTLPQKVIDSIPSGDLESRMLNSWTERERLYLMTPKHPKTMDQQPRDSPEFPP